MADLALTPAQELLRNAARDFIERECPLAEVRRIDEEEDGFSRALWEQIAGLGWLGLLVPAEHGGEGGSLTDAAVLYETIGRAPLPGPHHASAVLGALLLGHAGSNAQRGRLLPAIARGERIVALAFTEPDYAWTPGAVRATATRRGNAYVLDGTKAFVPYAGAADTLVCAARTSPDQQDGLTLFLVEKDAPGVRVDKNASWSGEPLYQVALAGVSVAAEDVIGEVDRGWRALEPVLDAATALRCASVAGAARRVYEISLAYAQQRVQFGQPIARFQRVQDHLVEMLSHADAARWTAYEAVWRLENDRPDAREAVSVAKMVASEGFYQLCDAAHHVHGGIGSEKGYGLSLYTKRSRSFYHELGDPAHHRRRLARLLDL